MVGKSSWGSYIAPTANFRGFAHTSSQTMSSYVQKANVCTFAPQPAIPLPFSSQCQSQYPRECLGTMSVLRPQSAYDAETHPGGQTHHHCPSGEFRRRAAACADVYRCLALHQHWRKRPLPKLKGVLANISCDEIAVDGRGRLRKGNGVRQFDMVRPSALDFLFCDTNFAFF